MDGLVCSEVNTDSAGAGDTSIVYTRNSDCAYDIRHVRDADETLLVGIVRSWKEMQPFLGGE